MFIYFLNILIVFILYYIIYHSNTQRKWFLKASLIYLFFISSLRDMEIGADHIPYVSAFNTIQATGAYYMEYGYVLLNRFVGIFTSHYIGISIATNLMLFIPLYFYIKTYVKKDNWPLIVFVFASNPYMFIQTTFNAMRQECATGIILIGMYFLLKHNRRRFNTVLYLIAVVCAAQFHRIAYVFLFLPIVTFAKWEKKHWLIVFIVSVVANISGFVGIIEVAINQLHISSNYINYGDSLLNNPIYILFIIFVFGYLLYHYNDLIGIDDTTRKIANLFYFSLCFLIFSLRNDMIHRVYMMVSFCALPGISVVCENVKMSTNRIRIRNEHRVVKSLFILYYLAYYTGYVALLAINGNRAYVPFKFFF